MSKYLLFLFLLKKNTTKKVSFYLLKELEFIRKYVLFELFCNKAWYLEGKRGQKPKKIHRLIRNSTR